MKSIEIHYQVHFLKKKLRESEVFAVFRHVGHFVKIFEIADTECIKIAIFFVNPHEIP